MKSYPPLKCHNLMYQYLHTYKVRFELIFRASMCKNIEYDFTTKFNCNREEQTLSHINLFLL